MPGMDLPLLTAGDERRHRLVGDAQECLRLDVLGLDESGRRFGLVSQLALGGPTGQAEVVVVLLVPGSSPVVLAEDDLVVPTDRWELRGSGIWIDHVCEAPLDRWSFGLEAFALALDDPEQLIRDGVGDRVPIGWELEFDATEAATWEPHRVEAVGYRQPGAVEGVLLDSDGEHPFTGSAVRRHWWGAGRPTPLGFGDPGPEAAACVVHHPDRGAVTATEFGVAGSGWLHSRIVDQARTPGGGATSS